MQSSIEDLARAAFWAALSAHCQSIGFRRPTLKRLTDIRCANLSDRFRCEADGNNGIRAVAMVKFDSGNEDRASVVINTTFRTLNSQSETPQREYPIASTRKELRELMFSLSRESPALKQEPRQEMSPEMQLKIQLAMGLFVALEREQMLRGVVPNMRTHRELKHNIGCYVTPRRRECP